MIFERNYKINEFNLGDNLLDKHRSLLNAPPTAPYIRIAYTAVRLVKIKSGVRNPTDFNRVFRISDDNEGKMELDNFINPEEKYPVIATTSKLMTTGVDA